LIGGDSTFPSRCVPGRPCRGGARQESRSCRPSADSSPGSQSACGRPRGPSRSGCARIELCRSHPAGT